MSKTSLLLLVALLFGALSCIEALTNSVDSAALKAFYAGLTTDGQKAIGWNTQNSFCDAGIPGLSCTTGKVTQLIVTNAAVTGGIASELAQLTSLTYLSLGSGFTGVIPTQLAGLAKLTRFELIDASGITGTLNPNWGSTSKLTYLAITGTQINGNIPSQLGSSKTISQLFLTRNKLSSTIPTEVGTMAALAVLELSSNSLNGALPTELAGLNLEVLHLTDNQFIGPVPTQFADLMDTLTELQLDQNGLTGMIPGYLNSPSTLGYLALADNDFCYGVDYTTWATETDYVDNGPLCENCDGYCENGGTCNKGETAPVCACVPGLSPPVCHFIGCNVESYDHTNWNRASFGETATGTCQTGYASIGTPERDCSAGGVWSSKPRNRCITIKCLGEGPWPTTSAGRQSTLFDCASGVGKRIRVCSITGSWGPVLNYCN